MPATREHANLATDVVWGSLNVQVDNLETDPSGEPTERYSVLLRSSSENPGNEAMVYREKGLLQAHA